MPYILFVTDYQRVHCKAEGKVFSEFLGASLFNALKKAGLYAADYLFITAADLPTVKLSDFKIIVPLGEEMLQKLTGQKSISKWHTSIIKTTAEYGMIPCLPMYHPEHVQRAWADHVYYQFGAAKLKSKKFEEPKRTFHTNLTVQQAITYLRDEVMTASVIAVDFEFGQGQLNTVGFAVSETEAIAIKTLPDDYTPEEYHALFVAIANVLESGIPKVIQHAAIEVTWAARYGIEMHNVTWDTMWAMKFVYPELDKGLDNVGRVFTPFPYWKDDNDDWTNVRDWQRHLEYNCKDTTATLWAYREQAKVMTMEQFQFFKRFLMRFQVVIQEMCVSGLRINTDTILTMKEELERERDNFMRIIDQECNAALNKTINPKSPKQLKEALSTMGMKLPTKRVKGKQDEQTSTDKKALVKLRRKYPKAEILPALIGLSAANKRLSSYIDFDYDRGTQRVHYTLDGCGTETGRWSGFGSAWGTGFNPQTVPKAVRRCFIPDDGTVFVQIDLKQAESRYVAWDGPDPKLMELLEEGRDVHRYVAGKIFKKPEEMVTEFERNLGKKAGHASNYGTGPRTFAEMALVEMGYYLEEREAKDILEGYMMAFPGVRKRQQNVKALLYQQRMLKTPLGRVRHFFGRMDDSTFREAYAYCPQSTIPDITNYLMLKLWDERDYLGLAYEEQGRFLLQVHDSLLLQCRENRLSEVVEFARDLKNWHPDITLPGGKLLIPVDIEYGTNWKGMKKI